MLSNIYKFNTNNAQHNYRKDYGISFKHNINIKEINLVSKDALKVLGTAITSLGIALININNETSTKKKFDHKFLAEKIIELLDENKSVKEICSELGISVGLYCNILKEFDIQTKTKIVKKNKTNINLEAFIKDVLAQRPRYEILAKYNITEAQFYSLLKSNKIKSKLMIEKEVIKNITPEIFLEAIRSSSTKKEVCNKLGIKSTNTYNYLKLKFKIDENPVRKREKWENLSSKEKFELLDSEKSFDEIKDEFNISKNTIQVNRKIAGIKSPTVISRENAEKLDVQSLQNDINEGTTEIDELLKKYNISKGQFQVLLDRKLITTSQKKSRDLVASITKEYLQQIINESSSSREVYTKLGISKPTFYNLVTKHKVDVPWIKKQNRLKPVSKNDLLKAINENLTIDEICKKFNISQHMYYKLIREYSISLRNPTLSEKFKNIATDTVISEINDKDTHKEVYESLGLTRYQYSRILRKNGIITEHQKTIKRLQELTPRDLLNDILDGLTIKEIADKYKVSKETINFLLKQHSIDHRVNGFTVKNKSLENMTIQELKKSLVSLFVKNECIGKNKIIANIINNIFLTKNITEDDKLHLIALNRILLNIANNNITPEEAINRDEIKYYLNKLS